MRSPRPATAARPPARTPPAPSSTRPRRRPRCALDAIQLLGGNGYINDYPTGRLLRDAKLYEIGAGTSEIRRMLIGRELFAKTALNRLMTELDRRHRGGPFRSRETIYT